MKLKFRAETKSIVMFVIFCIFLLYVVAICVINLNSFAVDGIFIGWNPFPAFGSKFLVATVTFYILAMVAVITSTSSLFFEREKGFGIVTSKKDEKGYTRWLDEKEVMKLPDVKKIILKDEKYESAGIPMLLKEKEAYVDNGENHSLIIGSTGSGKTQCVILPMVKILAKAGESMIITDPKGEIYKETGNLLRAHGYKIILLNFRDPLHGNAWNPFTLPYKFYKEGKQDKSMELLEDLGANILVDPNNKGEPFWENSASDYFAGLSIGLFEDADEREINLNSINYMATVGDERIGNSNYIKEYFGTKDPLSSAVVSASSTVNAPADTKGGIVSTFRTKTRIFSSRDILSEMLSYSDFDFRTFGTEKTAVFLMIHDEKKTYHALATIFVKQAYESLVDVAQSFESGKLPIRTNFLLDEFANMPAIRDVDAMITASRSRNIRFNFIIQNFSQLNQTYGADMAETIKGNCGNLHFLLTTELKALEEISKRLGDEKPKKPKENMPAEPIRPLVAVSDLQMMKKFEFVIQRSRSNPFKAKFKPDHELNKNGCWGPNYTASEFPGREFTQVPVFDIKTFVHKHREAAGIPVPGQGFGPSYMPPFAPGMGGMNPMAGMGMPPMGQPNMMGGMPGSSMQQGAPVGMPPKADFDAFMKNLEKKIAELEAEEEAEKKKISEGDVKETTQSDIKVIPESVVNTSINENISLEPQISVPLNPIKPPLENVSKEKVLDNIITDENNDLKKPKVNIDVDSIVVENPPVDNDFFDDFFGDDD